MRMLLLMVVLWGCAGAATGASVFIEDLTWTEVRQAQQAGRRTIIVPVGGTEQNGPHMALGKHNARVRVLAGRIAAELGDALVAPVLAYVPEGRIDPPSGHMRFAGTISVPDDAFQSVLAGAARSFKRGGFSEVVLIGDSGNYQGQLKDVAARLNREWAGSGVRAHHIAAYYGAVQGAYVQALRAKGLTAAQIGTHAGTADTALLLALEPSLVRADRLKVEPGPEPVSGVAGDPRPATAALGQLGVDLIVRDSVAAIRAATQPGR